MFFFQFLAALMGLALIGSAFAAYGGARILLLVLGVVVLLGSLGHYGGYGYYGYGYWYGPRVIVAPYGGYYRPYGVPMRPYGAPVRPGPYRRY
jgi:hypothetical protein